MNWQACRPLKALAPHCHSAKRLEDGRVLLLRDFPQLEDHDAARALLNASTSMTHPALWTPSAWRFQGEGLEIAFPMPTGASLESSLRSGMSIRALFNTLSDVVDGFEALREASVTHGAVDLWSIWRPSPENGLLLTPNPMPESAARDDLQSLARLAVSALRGSHGYSLPPAPSEADIARLLPASDRSLVPVLAPLLSKRQDAERIFKFKDAISVLELKAEWPERSVRTGEVSAAEIRRTFSEAPRAESVVPRAKHKRLRKQARSSLGVGGLLVFLLILLASAVAALYMSPRAEEFLVQAMRDAGILREPFRQSVEGLLAQGADTGSGLAVRVAAYRDVLARMPGHAQATAELRQLIAETREAIGEALAAGRLDVANQRLGEALSLFSQDEEFRRQFDELSERRLAENLFVNTLALVEEGDLSDEEGLTAIEAYREVVRLWPGHEGAGNALKALARHFADEAEASVAANDIANAMMFLEHATRADGEIDEVVNVRAQIQRGTDMLREVESLLEAGARLFAAGALVNPPAENAAETYGRVLASDPDNPIAAEGLRQVTAGVIEGVEVAIAQEDYARARALLGRALQTALDEDALADVGERLELEQARTERLRDLLRQAEQLLADGYITAPEEDNLLAKLFEVFTLDSDNATALVLRERAAERLAEVAEDAWGAGMADEAREYLRVALTLVPDRAAWVEKQSLWSAEAGA